MELKELKLTNRWVQIHDFEADPEKECIVIPPLMAYLPLAVWANAEGYQLVTPDPWEYDRSYHRTPVRPADYPDNLSAAQLRTLALTEADQGTKVFPRDHQTGELPNLHQDKDVFWDTVQGIRVHYDIIRGDGSTWIATVTPDIFIYEDETDTYHVFATDPACAKDDYASTATYPLLDGAIEAFANPAMTDKGSLSDSYNGEWYCDYRLTELRIQAAAASKRFDHAAQLALNHFGLPTDTASALLRR